MCTTRKNSAPSDIADATTDPNAGNEATAQCSNCKRKGLGTCPALKSRDALLIPIINDGSTALAAASDTATATIGSTIASITSVTDADAAPSNQP